MKRYTELYKKVLDNDDNDDDDNNDAVSDDEFMYSFVLQFKFRFAFSQPTSINESTRDVQTNKAVMKVLVLQHDFFFFFFFLAVSAKFV